MPYTIHILDATPARDVLVQLTIGALGEFTLEPRIVPGTPRKPGVRIELYLIRLVHPKAYCGQHPGVCVANGRKKKVNKLLEWDDWVRFHAVVNDALDELKASADVWSLPMEANGKMWIRKGTQRRHRYEWTETPGAFGRPIQHWDMGSPSQFLPEAP